MTTERESAVCVLQCRRGCDGMRSCCRVHDLQHMEQKYCLEAHDSEVLCLEYTKPSMGTPIAFLSQNWAAIKLSMIWTFLYCIHARQQKYGCMQYDGWLVASSNGPVNTVIPAVNLIPMAQIVITRVEVVKRIALPLQNGGHRFLVVFTDALEHVLTFLR